MNPITDTINGDVADVATIVGDTPGPTDASGPNGQAVADTTDEILVAGQWRRGAGAPIESSDPSSGAVFAVLHAATVADVHLSVDGARRALAQSRWADWLPQERASVLRRIANRVDSQVNRIARLQTLDTGKTLSETTALARSAAGTFHFMASAAETMSGEITPSRGEYLTLATHEPIGVIGTITPWNSPIASDAQKIAPALAAGNAVIAKPPVWAPWVTLLLARLCDDAGLPAGLLSVLPGPGRTVGDAVVRHPDIGKVSFTGGTSTGRQLAHVAADKLMPITLELGGKSPTIVFSDANIDQTVAGILFGIFSSSGQSCVAGSRVFIERSVYDETLARLVAATRALRVGPGTDPRTQVAPMITHSHRDTVAAMVDAAVAAGAQVRCGGAIPDDPELADGAYYLPTILDGVDNAAAICQQEIFGPVAVVIPFDDEADLIAAANDTVFGLACGVWTSDFARAWRIAHAVRAGTVWINTYKQFSISTPFSGVKESGVGTEKGRDGIKSYMNQKSIYLDTAGTPLPWADPAFDAGSVDR